MNPFISDLRNLFSRDMDRLIHDLKKIDDDTLWNAPEGVQNSCGVIVQHLIGNLRHFIGNGLGNTGYQRERKKEFENTEKSKTVLIGEVEDVKNMSIETLYNLDEQFLGEPFPMEVSFDFTVRHFLLHLYGHLNYHLGQFNYLRRLNR